MTRRHNLGHVSFWISAADTHCKLKIEEKRIPAAIVFQNLFSELFFFFFLRSRTCTVKSIWRPFLRSGENFKIFLRYFVCLVFGDLFSHLFSILISDVSELFFFSSLLLIFNFCRACLAGAAFPDALFFCKLSRCFWKLRIIFEIRATVF